MGRGSQQLQYQYREAKQAAHLAVGVEEGTDGAVGLVEGSCRVELPLSLEAGCLVLPLQRKQGLQGLGVTDIVLP